MLTVYEAHHRGEPVPPGEYVRAYGGGSAPLTVREPSQCAPVAPLGLHVEVSDPGARSSGEPLVWVGVDSEQAVCCVEPLGAVRSTLHPDGLIDLQLFGCVLEDCFCMPTEATPFIAWHSLGPLAPGRYTVRAGPHEARFRVR